MCMYVPVQNVKKKKKLLPVGWSFHIRQLWTDTQKKTCFDMLLVVFFFFFGGGGVDSKEVNCINRNSHFQSGHSCMIHKNSLIDFY